MKKTEFLAKLEEEAALQSKLHRERLLPRQLDPITSLIGNYTWQVLVIMSLLSAILIEVLKIT